MFRRYWLLFAFGWMIVILGISIWPRPPVLDVGPPGSWALAAHLALYAILGGLYAWSSKQFLGSRKKAVFVAFFVSVLAASAYGAVMELAQMAIATRDPSWQDVWTNGSGSILGALVVMGAIPWIVQRYRNSSLL